MDSDEIAVYGIIRGHTGLESAVSVGAISERSGVPPRQVRDIVKGLIERHRVRIGSSLSNPPGYYLIATDEEAERNERTLRRLGLSVLTRAAVLKRLTVAEYMKRLQVEIGI
jgi:sugar-specific transcriptional regulator TrmB